ncbi:MAG: CorA family divalent cation transporter [Cyanobium sp. CZS 25K]|nr:CorA family divalent cation transporter [Cyanobium sp. CZS25K]
MEAMQMQREDPRREVVRKDQQRTTIEQLSNTYRTSIEQFPQPILPSLVWRQPSDQDDVSGACFHQIGADGPAKHVATAAAAIAAADGDGFAWWHYRQATREDFSELVGLFGLHPLAVKDCFDDKQIPKIEDFPGNTFVLFNTFQYVQSALVIGEINLFLGKKFLISVSHLDSQDRSYLDGALHIVDNGIEEARQGPSHLMHFILDDVVDQKFVAIEALEDELDDLEGALISDSKNFQPAELIRFRRYLLVCATACFTSAKFSARSVARTVH